VSYIIECKSGKSVYGESYYEIMPVWNPDRKELYNQDLDTMIEWCIENYGPTGSEVWGAKRWWYDNDSKFWFKEDRDVVLFLLRWG